MKIRPKLIPKYLWGSIITPIITQNLTFPALKRLLKLGLRNYNNSYDTYYGDPNDSKSIDKVKETPISEGLMRDNIAISEGLMLNNTSTSLVYDNSNSEVSLTPNLEELISNIKNRRDSVEQPVIKGEQKKNNPPVNDSKVIESYEKDSYDDLVLSEKAKESYENWLRSRHREPGKNNWESFKTRFSLFINNPDLWATGRLAVNLGYNDRIYDEYLKGLNPVLKLSYNTYRQVFGDEATKQGYYRRATLLLTRASRPFTSNAETSLAAMFDAYAKGNEMRAEGDRADNQRIRETSEIANQHLDANRLRATEVANYNIASMALTEAQKHALLAQKLSAEGSSIDNWLLGVEYRKRLKNARLDAINDLIFALDEQERLSNDEDYLKAYDRWEAWKSKHKTESGAVDSSHPDYLKEKNLYTNAILLRQRKSLRRMQAYKANGTTDFDGFIYAKSGTKITKKLKDDLLYKSAKDVVEHFRKMIALDKRSPKSNNKIEKLTSHPKGNTKKYLLGGVAPFLVYKPIALGGETTTSTQTGTSSTKSSSEKEGLDLLKELFKALLVEGLPSDVNGVFQAMNNLMSKRAAFGLELSTEDIASMYLLSIQQINTIKFNKAQFDAASKNVSDKDAILEFAVDTYGRLAVQDKEGKVSFMKWNDIKDNLDKYNPLTNNDLLNLRAYSPDLAFNSKILEVVNNGIGMSKIVDFLNSLLPKLGSSEQTIEGYTKLDSNMIKAGLLLLKDAPAGDYKMTQYNKDLLKQALMALSYLASILPNNMKSVLLVHASMLGISTKDMLLTLIGSQMSGESRIEFDAVTGKAAKDSNGNSKESSELKLDAATALISGKGYLGAIEFNPGTSYAVTVNARHSGFLKKSGENMGSGITMLEATTSTLDKVLDWNKATLGGSRLNPTGYNRIMINNDDVVGVDLPVESDKNTPDFTMLLKLQVLDLELLKKGIEDTPNNWKQVNQVCLEIGLPAKYKNDGSLNEYSWNRFAAFQVTADDSVLVNKNAILSDILGVVEDDDIREQYELIILKDNKNYKLGSGFLGLGKQALYLGTVFVPINSNYVASALSGGLNISMLQATNLELRERGYDLLKIATYKPGININEL